MEDSSHAIALERILGLEFDVVAMTSFSQDHLDFHKSIDDYFSTKMKIAYYLKSGMAFFVPAEEEALCVEVKTKLSVLNINFQSVKFDRETFLSMVLPPFLLTEFNQKNLSLALALNKFLWSEKVERLIQCG
jgi:UDP-N-acetylmuramoyl-L-alanyl-D-glutamate--2,6-diaminopimelate ligase